MGRIRCWKPRSNWPLSSTSDKYMYLPQGLQVILYLDSNKNNAADHTRQVFILSEKLCSIGVDWMRGKLSSSYPPDVSIKDVGKIFDLDAARN
jgi:hypothetical protein